MGLGGGKTVSRRWFLTWFLTACCVLILKINSHSNLKPTVLWKLSPTELSETSFWANRGNITPPDCFLVLTQILTHYFLPTQNNIFKGLEAVLGDYIVQFSTSGAATFLLRQTKEIHTNPPLDGLGINVSHSVTCNEASCSLVYTSMEETVLVFIIMI